MGIPRHTLFLKWWLFMAAVTALAGYSALQGGILLLWERDQTKLSFLLLIIFVQMSIWCGYKTWRLSRFLDSEKTEKYLDWNPKTNMEEGLKKTIEWFKNNKT